MTIQFDRGDFRRRFGDLRTIAGDLAVQDASSRYLALLDEFEVSAQPVRHALLSTPLAWGEEERRDARWLNRSCDDFAALGYRISASTTSKRLGVQDADVRALVAATLRLMGDTVKWDICVAPDAPHDLRKVHALMRLAMETGRHREPVSVRVDGRTHECTVESLYFRVLLLARFASGALNGKQIEILDAWMWLWMPALTGVAEPPPGAALRADLDSSSGLQRGPREGEGPSLYIPQGPIEDAYRAIVAEFHAGRIVPSEGLASEFRIEEHIAVLDRIRQGMRESKSAPMGRSSRRRVHRTVELHLGLGQIISRGLAASPPPPSSPASMSLSSRSLAASGKRRTGHDDSPIGDIYEVGRRVAQLVDQSDTGLGLEVARADNGEIAAGDLVGVRVSPGEPLQLGKVVRGMSSKEPGRVFLGIHRLPGRARLIDVRLVHGSRPDEDLAVVFVPGADSCGRHDAILVSERTFAERAKLVVAADGNDFTFRLNRVRDRGRGWVLAGFEVVTMRPRVELEIA